jgi:hypothetical protein
LQHSWLGTALWTSYKAFHDFKIINLFLECGRLSDTLGKLVLCISHTAPVAPLTDQRAAKLMTPELVLSGEMENVLSLKDAIIYSARLK